MVNYICPKCNKVFNRKSNYVDHTENKKNACNKQQMKKSPKRKPSTARSVSVAAPPTFREPSSRPPPTAARPSLAPPVSSRYTLRPPSGKPIDFSAIPGDDESDEEYDGADEIDDEVIDSYYHFFIDEKNNYKTIASYICDCFNGKLKFDSATLTAKGYNPRLEAELARKYELWKRKEDLTFPPFSRALLEDCLELGVADLDDGDWLVDDL